MTELDFKTAFKYPFNRPKGMWGILWILLPIIGWFVLAGYGVRRIQEFSKGKFKKLPAFKFSSDLELGFSMFLKALPFALVYIAVSFGLTIINPFLRFFSVIFEIFAIPILFINFINKETIASFFELRIVRSVFNNFGDYLIALSKSILLGIVFLVMFVVLVGIPAGTFTKNIFLADFYRRKVK